jgi:hypothetical protein
LAGTDKTAAKATAVAMKFWYNIFSLDARVKLNRRGKGVGNLHDPLGPPQFISPALLRLDFCDLPAAAATTKPLLEEMAH